MPLQLGPGSPSLGRRGPRDMESDHMCDGVPVRVRQSFASYVWRALCSYSFLKSVHCATPTVNGHCRLRGPHSDKYTNVRKGGLNILPFHCTFPSLQSSQSDTVVWCGVGGPGLSGSVPLDPPIGFRALTPWSFRRPTLCNGRRWGRHLRRPTLGGLPSLPTLFPFWTCVPRVPAVVGSKPSMCPLAQF